ncbi:low molecular weight phosphotyrosine protein phosphatase-like [Tubulanus polymorphus]|uniref:low molecular weight phosphotyrosine protein phosphatase-like n=1 Tax=Tubulanus polymorphus TaxID=672921 RepID=UPI003DA695C7
MAAPSKSVLFVCLGNICRSPMAEEIFRQMVKQKGELDEWKIDSAALGSWHIGSQPEKRGCKNMEQHKMPMNHMCRQVHKDDFKNFKYIFGFDNENISELKRMRPANSESIVKLLGDYDPEGIKIIRDPYYDSGDKGFEDCYQQSSRCCKAFLDEFKV